MDLDKRVQRLEEDVTILKNQIRNTLLDIQEQLAASYHPGLRASRGPARQGARPPHDDEPREADDDGDEAPPPRVRKVSLKELRHDPDDDAPGRGADATRPGNGSAPTGAAAPGAHTDLVLYTELIKWANASVAKVGAEHTRRVLETYAADGHIPAQMAASVVQLASLGVGGDAPAPEAPVADVLMVLMSLNEVLAGTGTARGAAVSVEGARG